MILSIKQKSKRSFLIRHIIIEKSGLGQFKLFDQEDYTPIKRWLDDSNINHKEYIKEARIRLGNPKLSSVRIVFYSDATATLFKLWWM